jgi:hypothetical protein
VANFTNTTFRLYLVSFFLLDIIDSIDKHELTGQNLSQVFNSTCAWGPKNARLLKYQAAMFQFRDQEVKIKWKEAQAILLREGREVGIEANINN